MFANPDPRAYPIAGFDSLVVPPTEAVDGLPGFAFYGVCDGQAAAVLIGYAPLPITLERAAIDRIRRLPGADPAAISLANCANPTFSPDGTNLLDDVPGPCPGTCEALTTTVRPGALMISVEPGDVVLPPPALTAI